MIGKNIQQIRKQKNLTQQALADQTGVSRQTVAKWEAGDSVPDLETAGRLASVLDVPLDDLVNAPVEELDEKSGLKGKHMFGLVTVGDKGQIVIPIRARRVLKIRPGDQLMVLGDEERGLALMHDDFFMAVVEGIKNGL